MRRAAVPAPSVSRILRPRSPCRRPCSPPKVARWVGERLAAPYRFKYLQTDLDAPLPEQFQAASMDEG
jgi:hypothetical protein